MSEDKLQLYGISELQKMKWRDLGATIWRNGKDELLVPKDWKAYCELSHEEKIEADLKIEEF